MNISWIRLKCLTILTCSVLSTLGLSESSFQWKPDLKDLALFDIALLDPSMTHSISDARELEDLYTNWKHLKTLSGSELKNLDLEDLWEHMTGSMAFYNFMVTKFYQTHDLDLDPINLKEEPYLLKTKMLSLLEMILEKDLSLAQRTIAKFQKHLFALQINPMKEKNFEPLNQLDPRHLNQDQQNLLQYLKQFPKLYSKEASSRDQAISILQKLKTKMSHEASAFVHLFLARLKVGYSIEGNKIAWYHSSYEKHLNIISKTCRSYSKEANTEILSSMLSVWTQARNFSKTWDTPPFQSECYTDLEPFLAVQEQQVDDLMADQQFTPAIEKLSKMLAQIKNQSQKMSIQAKLLSIADQAYEAHQDFPLLQSRYFSVLEQRPYNFEAIEDKIFYATLNYVKKHHEHISRQDVVAVMNDFISHSRNQDSIYEILSLQASSLEQQKQYETSWSIYEQLASITDDPELKREHLEKATQQYITSIPWNEETPWDHMDQTTQEEAEILMRLYSKRVNLSPTPVLDNWLATLNLGTLFIREGRPEEAHNLWVHFWNATTDIPNIEHVSGFLIDSLAKHQSWELAQSIFASLIESGIQAEWKGHHFDENPNINLALQKADQSTRDAQLAAHIEDIKAQIETNPHSENKMANIEEVINYYRMRKQASHELSYLERYLSSDTKEKPSKNHILRALHLTLGMGQITKSLSYYRTLKTHFSQAAEVAQLDADFAPLCSIQSDRLNCSTQTAHEENTTSPESIKQLSHSHKQASTKGQKGEAGELLVNGSKRASDEFWISEAKSSMRLHPILNLMRKVGREIEVEVQDHNYALHQYNLIRKQLIETCKEVDASFCVKGINELLRLSQKIQVLLKDVHQEKISQLFAQHQLKVRDKLLGMLNKYTTLPEVTDQTLWTLKQSWNFSDSIYSGVGFIQLNLAHLN